MKSRISTRPFQIALSGLLCFVISLPLPAVRVIIFSSPADVAGWQAMASAVGLGAAACFHIFESHTWNDVRLALLGIAGSSNLAFIALPVALHRRFYGIAVLRWFGAVSAIGVMLAAVAPFAFEKTLPKLLIGYYIWLLGYGLLLVAVILAWIEQRANSEACRRLALVKTE